MRGVLVRLLRGRLWRLIRLVVGLLFGGVGGVLDAI
jgi:hypothetical protein